MLWRQKYGTISRGAPLIADGKLYVFDVNAKLAVFKLKGDEEPEELESIPFRKESGAGFVETHGTPIAVNSRLYFLTQDGLYCVGKPAAPAAAPAAPPADTETPFSIDAAPVAVRIFPADVAAKPGEVVELTAKFLDANGREVKAPADAKLEWALPQPPLPPTAAKGAAAPPALNAELAPAGVAAKVTLGKLPRQQGTVTVKFGALTASARVRVAAGVP